jgi:hypothetical protein
MRRDLLLMPIGGTFRQQASLPVSGGELAVSA